MKLGRLRTQATGAVVVNTVYRTSNAWERLRGLLARPPLKSGEGLLIVPCASVHTLFMGYPIDLVYLDRNYHVTRVVHRLPPWRASLGAGAAMTLELPAGSAVGAGIERGMPLTWEASV